MFMKKLFAVLMAVLMVTVFASCGQKTETPSGNEVTELLEQGYSFSSLSADETQWKAVLQNEEAPGKLYYGKASFTSELYETYNAIDLDDDEGLKAFVAGLDGVTLTDISDRIPAQEELDAYVGKTVGELEDAGFENTGNINDGGKVTFCFDGPVYCCNVTLTEDTVIEDLNDLSVNDIRALEIGGMEYTGLSSYLIDNLD